MNIRMTFQVNENQRRAIGRAMGHRRGKHPATRAEFAQWATTIITNELFVATQKHNRLCADPDPKQLRFASMTEPVQAETT